MILLYQVQKTNFVVPVANEEVVDVKIQDEEKPEKLESLEADVKFYDNSLNFIFY